MGGGVYISRTRSPRFSDRASRSSKLLSKGRRRGIEGSSKGHNALPVRARSASFPRMKRLAAAATLVAALSPSVRAAIPEPRGPALHIEYTRFRLQNGLTVIFHEDHSLPTVAVDIWFRVGSKDERAGKSGFAHLFEHLMFMGTKSVPNGRYDSVMEAAGGQNNASTSEDRTNYFETGPSNLLETFLWLESDRIATLADDMTKEKVDLQRDVVMNERRQSYENRPYGIVELVLPEHLFPVDHPYHHPVIGSHEDLTAASVDDVKAFFRQFYVPSNASLLIAGDFHPSDAKRLVERYFGWMPKVAEPPHAAPVPVALAKSERIVVKDSVQLPRTTLAWHSPSAFADGDATSDVLAALLGTGQSSRLYKALVYDRKIAQQVEVEQRSMRLGSEFVITALAQPGHDAAELEQAIDQQIAALIGPSPPTKDEVDRARAFSETQQLRQLEPLLGRAEALQLFEFAFADPGQLGKRLLAQYDRLTARDVARQAKKMFAAPHLTIQVVPR